MIPHIMNGNGTISIMLDGSMKPIDTAHKNYEAIKTAIKEKDWDSIPSLVNIAEEVQNAIDATGGAGMVKIKDGEVFYGDTVIHNTLTDRIIAMAKEGFDISHMVVFLENLMQNPSYRAVNELYSFLEAGSIPITENGTFLTYKKINKNWTDIYTGKMDNSIGATVSMPRNMVNEDSQQTCSAGLHVCSYDYLPSFGSATEDRVVICEVHPANVVSIPADYNNTKMRCCEYTVIGEVEDYRDENVLAKNAVVYTNDVRENNQAIPEDYGKQIGKWLEEGLNSGTIRIDEVETALSDAGATQSAIAEIMEKIDNDKIRKACKIVARLVDIKDMNGTKFRDILEGSAPTNDFPSDVENNEEPEFFDGCCPECGAENRWHEDEQSCEKCDYVNDEWIEWKEAQDAAQEVEPETRLCDRCGADLDDGEDECGECGYWSN